jgi:hypothetical protein
MLEVLPNSRRRLKELRFEAGTKVWPEVSSTGRAWSAHAQLTYRC